MLIIWNRFISQLFRVLFSLGPHIRSLRFCGSVTAGFIRAGPSEIIGDAHGRRLFASRETWPVVEVDEKGLIVPCKNSISSIDFETNG